MKNETYNKRKNYDCNHIVLSGVLLKCGRRLVDLVKKGGKAMKLQNPALINPDLFNRVDEIRVQKTLLKIFLTIAVASVLFMIMTVIAS